MYQKDHLDMSRVYQKMLNPDYKPQVVEEGMLDRLATRYAGVKGTVQGVRDRIAGYGQTLKAAGQLATGNREAGIASAQAGLEKIKGAKNLAQKAKIDTIVSRHAKEMVNDLTKLGLNPRDKPLTAEALTSILTKTLADNGIAYDAVPSPVSPVEPSAEVPDEAPEVDTPAETAPTEPEPEPEAPLTPEVTTPEPVSEEPPTSPEPTGEPKKPSISARIKEIEDTIKADGDASGAAGAELTKMKKIQKQMQTGRRQRGIKASDVASFSESLRAYYKSLDIIS